MFLTATAANEIDQTIRLIFFVLKQSCCGLIAVLSCLKMRMKLFLVQRYGLRLAAISKMYCPRNHKTSAVSLSRCFCTSGIGISKNLPCSAVVPYRATICSSISGVKAGFGYPRLSYRSTWPEAGCYPFPYR